MTLIIVYTAIKTSRIILRIACLSCGAMTRTIAPTRYSGTTVKQTKVRGGWSADSDVKEAHTMANELIILLSKINCDGTYQKSISLIFLTFFN